MTPTRLRVYVQPRARRTELAGRHGDAIRIRLAAPPVDNAANEALVIFVAEQLALPRRAVRLVAGLASRHKTLEIDGLSPETVAARMGA